MLINKHKQKEPGDVLFLKLVTNEEVIGEIVVYNQDTIGLKRPMSLQMTQQGIGLGPYTFLGDEQEPVMFKVDKVVSEGTPSNDMANSYISACSGIQTGVNPADLGK